MFAPLAKDWLFRNFITTKKSYGLESESRIRKNVECQTANNDPLGQKGVPKN